jgi:hypothetical protein
MASAPYTYHPLRNEAGIRVLLLEPASTQGAPLFVSLQHIQILQHFEDDLDDQDANAMASSTSIPNTSQVEFEAISYAWGTEEPNVTLGVHRSMPREHFKISPVLDTMLRYIRLPKKKRCVWIDALCINQKNNKEKEAQVNFMGEIYRQAKGIIVWLGPPINTQDDVLRFFQNLVKYGQEDSEYLEERAVTWDKLRIFLKRSWFTRRWTIQEAVLAKQAIMLCGKHMINFMVFAKHACLLAQHQPYAKIKLVGVIRKLRMMYELRAAHVLHTEIDPLSMFVDFSTAECTNERDRIYALNALGSMRMPVSYNNSVEEVFITYAKMHVDLDNYAIINCAGAFRSKKTVLPSWVPDWQYLPIYTPLATQLVLQRPVELKMKYMEVIGAKRTADSIALSLTGVKYGVASYIGAKAPFPVFGGDLLRLLKDWYAIFESNASKSARRSSSPDALARQFISTITLGTVVKRSNTLGPDHPWLHDEYSEEVPGISTILAHLIHEETELDSAAAWLGRAETPTSLDAQAKVDELIERMANSAITEPQNTGVKITEMATSPSQTHALESPNTQAKVSEIPTGLKDTLKYLTYTPSSLLPNLHYDKKSIWGSVKHSLSEEGDYGQNLEPKEVVEILCRSVAGRTCFWSSDGSFSLGPANMEIGDVVVAIPSCPSLYVLREKVADTEEGDRIEYALVGDCYVHDFKPDDISEGEDVLQQFRIV